MRQFLSLILLCLISLCVLYSCEKWKDPKSVTDPRLTNPYCNDPNAVNYNWGFPGKPDNTVCFYPSQLFKGTYMVHDSIYAGGIYIFADSFTMSINALNQTKISVFGFCPSGDSMLMTAGVLYSATVDTTEGDSVTVVYGQHFCRVQDTVSGTIARDRIDSPTVLHINLTVVSDTGTTLHVGTAVIQ